MSCALSDLLWWNSGGEAVPFVETWFVEVMLMGLRKLVRPERDAAGDVGGVLVGSISMMLARRRSAWWKASCRCAA